MYVRDDNCSLQWFFVSLRNWLGLGKGLVNYGLAIFNPPPALCPLRDHALLIYIPFSSMTLTDYVCRKYATLLMNKKEKEKKLPVVVLELKPFF